MIWFRFVIPKHPGIEGVVTYSFPVWCGTRPKCMKNEKALLYNDAEGYGIGQADDGYIAPDVQVLTKAEVDKALADAPAKAIELAALPNKPYTASKQVPTIWYGKKLDDRILVKTAAQIAFELADSPVMKVLNG